jgi:hypothetical protein
VRTRNEKILLGVLLAIIFVTGNYYGYLWLARKQSALDLSYAQLRADKAEAQLDLMKEDVWAQRQAWLKDHQPVLHAGEEDEAGAKVLQYVLKGARDNKLEIVEQSLNDLDHGPAGTRINVSVTIKGPMKGLCAWLADLQKPENFYAVPSFSLKADQDEKSYVCTLKLARYFKGGS